MTLSEGEVLRYSRHLIMPEVGMEGQERLKKASVLLVGCGGLALPWRCTFRSRDRKTGLVDFDVTEASNLQRQILFGTADVGRAKVEAARDRISQINPNVQTVLCRSKLASQNVLEIVKPYDMVIDGTDNFPARYLVNDACVLLRSRTSMERFAI